jgi:hypothetical protein
MPYIPEIQGPLSEMTPKQARSEYERLMSRKGERISALRELLRANGVHAACDDGSLDAIEEWFEAYVEPDPNNHEWLRPIWYGVVNDLALFVGHCIICNNPDLHWEFYRWGRHTAPFQRHVIMGFMNVKYAKYCLDIDDMLAVYAAGIVSGIRRENLRRFVNWMKVAAEFA